MQTPFTLAKVTSLDPNNETSMQACMWALQKCAPSVTGHKEWNENNLGKKVSGFLSKSDEAFMLVTLENQWEHWHDMFVTNLKKTSGFPVPYNNMSAENTASDGPCQPCRKFGCWNQLGMTAFNSYVTRVKLMRKQPGSQEDYWKSCWNSKADELLQSKKRKRNEHYLEEFVTAANDLFSSDEEDENDDDSDDADDYDRPTQTAEM